MWTMQSPWLSMTNIELPLRHLPANSARLVGTLRTRTSLTETLCRATPPAGSQPRSTCGMPSSGA